MKDDLLIGAWVLWCIFGGFVIVLVFSVFNVMLIGSIIYSVIWLIIFLTILRNVFVMSIQDTFAAYIVFIFWHLIPCLTWTV